MSDKETIGDAGREARFKQWEKIGFDRIKADLLNGGHRLVGGPPAVRELAWEWVRMKEASGKSIAELVGVELPPGSIEALLAPTPCPPGRPVQPRPELFTLKPTIWGMGVDLKELGRRIRDRFKK
jgi:hypothetical protein